MSLQEIDWSVYPIKVTRATGEVYYVHSGDEIKIQVEHTGQEWYFTERPPLRKAGVIDRIKRAYAVIRYGYI